MTTDHDQRAAFETAWPEIHKQGFDKGWRGVAEAAWQAAIKYVSEQIGAGGVSGQRITQPVESMIETPVGEVFTMEALDGTGQFKSHVLLTHNLPAGTKLYATPVSTLITDWERRADLEAEQSRIEVLS